MTSIEFGGEYRNLITCYLVMSEINGVNMQDFLYGYQLYLIGKRTRDDENATILANYLISKQIEMQSLDEATEVVDIKEYIENLENNGPKR